MPAAISLNDTITQALSIKEPWAWCIASGLKTIENRTWAPPASVIGKRIAIHASANLGDLGRDDIVDFMYDVDDQVGDALSDDRISQDSPLFIAAAIIGSVRVLGFIDLNKIGFTEPAIVEACAAFPKSPTGIPHRAWVDGGSVLWVVGEAERFATPIPAKGKLGVWSLTADQVEKVRVARGNLITDPGQPVELGLAKAAKSARPSEAIQR